MIEIKVTGSVVSAQETEALYCGAQEVYLCHFTFDRSWDRFTKTAVFRVDSKAVTALVDETDRCALPWELLTGGNIGKEVEVGLYGVSGDNAILTSVWDSIGAVREGTELGSDAREPSRGIYQQVMASVKRVDDKVTDYSTGIHTLTQRAESAAAVATDSAERAMSGAAAVDGAVQATENALLGVQEALANLPEGSTLIINDLTTGGKSAALSAEMGKQLEKNKVPVVSVPYSGSSNKSADDLTDPIALVPVSATVNSELYEIFGAKSGAYAYVRTYFYLGNTTTHRRMQVAYAYNTLPMKMAMRLYGGSGWLAWQEIARADEAVMKKEKPSGSYSGNGGTLNVTIGGIGEAVLITNKDRGLSAIVVFGGAITFNAGTITGLSWTEAQYNNGALRLNTSNPALNASPADGRNTYYYQVI